MHDGRLAHVCASIDYGYTASAKEGPNGPKFLRITDIVAGSLDWDTVPHCEADERTATKFRLDHGDIVVARTGATTGASAYISNPPPAVFASYLVRLKIDPKLSDPRYVSYYMKGPRFWEYVRGVLGDKSAQPNASAATLTQAPYAPPPITTQRSIAALLSSLDDKIEHNRRASRALEGLARAMFKAWFVDFEPVHAKAAGATSFPGMPLEAFAALPTSFTDSPLGTVPQGWGVVDVYTLANVVYGAPFKSKLFNEEGVGKRLIRIRDLQTHLPTVFTPELHPKGTLIRPGDIIVGMDGEFRLHYWTGPEAWLNQRLCSFSPLPGLPAVYLGEALRAPLDYVERSEAATTVIHLGKYDIDRFELLRPSDPVLAAFGAVTTPMLDAIVHLAAESRKLAELRDYLLPKLLSGEVWVSRCEAESVVSRP